MKKMTDAEKARLKKLQAGKGSLANGKLSMDEVLERQGLKKKELRTKAYSPAPMSAAAKAKAGAAGAASKKASSARLDKTAKGYAAARARELKMARGPKAGSSVVSKVVGRAKTVAREVRDIKTAVGTSLRDQEQNVRRAAMGVKPTGKNVGKNLRTQIKEVGSAIKSGKKGTSSDMYNKPGAYKSGTKRK
jgi:hypothetical protein